MRRPMIYPKLLAFVFATALFGQAAAVPILGVTASTPSTAAGDIANVVNGTGLSGGQLPSSLHAQSGTNTAWLSGATGANSQLDFDLGDLYALAGMAVWNANGSFSSRGINTVQILFSTDGVNYNTIPGSPTAFAQMPVAPSAPEIFSWSPLVARFVRFDVGSTFDTNGALVNEVLFDGTLPVPELDGTTALAPLSLMCFGLLTLKRRREDGS